MEKALKLSMEDISSRFISLIPAWIIGTGADFGRLYPYARQLSFSLIVYLFYQELLDDIQRTREDMIHNVVKLATTMKLECSYQEAEKIVDALLVSEGSTKHTWSFQDVYFDERTKEWKEYRFQFLEVDKDVSDLEEGHYVYKLSEASQQLFLNTNEIQQQLPIPVQQLLVEILIEKGDLKTALRVLDGLNHRVSRLIKEERHHKEELIRNPKKTIYENKSKWGEQLKRVQLQFQEEEESYQKMRRILKRIYVEPKYQDTYMQLTKRLYKTTNLHDKLAKLVIENIRLEIQIRNSQFKEMWLSNSSSFRRNVWEEVAQASGFGSPEDMLTIAESLFSPKKPYMLPLEWGLEEQTDNASENSFSTTSKKINTPLEPVELDWNNILLLWKEVFDELLKNQTVSIEFLEKKDEFSLARWVEHHEAFDYWITFASAEEAFVINDYNLQGDNDGRALLIAKLIEKYPEMEILKNKQIESIPAKKSTILRKKIAVSNYMLVLKEC